MGRNVADLRHVELGMYALVSGGRDRYCDGSIAAPIHYLMLTLQEETSTPLRFSLCFSFALIHRLMYKRMRLLEVGELNFALMKDLCKCVCSNICPVLLPSIHSAL